MGFSPKRVVELFCVGALTVTWACSCRPLLPTPTVTEGWRYSVLPERYDRETLYRYVDGKARVYLDYGFVKLDRVQFESPDGESFIDVEVYDMGSPEGAFGIYSLDRGDELPRHYRQRLGYMIGSARFFWKGQSYATISSTDDSPKTREAIHSLSSYLERSVPGSAEDIPLLGAFPADGKVHGSEQYFAINLLGHEFMGSGFFATYEEKGNRFKLFLSPKLSPEEAKQVYGKLKESLGEYGEVRGEVAGIGEMAFQGKDEYVGEWLVTVSGSYLLGVVGSRDDKEARSLLTSLCQRLTAVHK